MTDEQLQAIKARVAAATPGPWREWFIGKEPSGIITDANEDGVAQTFNRIDESYRNAGANAFFIAAARTDIPALVAEVERLRAQLAAVPVAGIWNVVYYQDPTGEHTDAVREWLPTGGAE